MKNFENRIADQSYSLAKQCQYANNSVKCVIIGTSKVKKQKIEVVFNLNIVV
ncbi:MAG: hypothetical protein ACI9SP_003632 [Arenicella sp.]|jgi:hypothetical protein